MAYHLKDKILLRFHMVDNKGYSPLWIALVIPYSLVIRQRDNKIPSSGEDPDAST